MVGWYQWSQYHSFCVEQIVEGTSKKDTSHDNRNFNGSLPLRIPTIDHIHNEPRSLNPNRMFKKHYAFNRLGLICLGMRLCWCCLPTKWGCELLRWNPGIVKRTTLTKKGFNSHSSSLPAMIDYLLPWMTTITVTVTIIERNPLTVASWSITSFTMII